MKTWAWIWLCVVGLLVTITVYFLASQQQEGAWERLQEKAEALLDQAVISRKQGLYDTALRDFQRAEQIWPSYKIIFMIARCLQRLNEYEDALRRFEETVREDKTQHLFVAHLHVAEYLLELNRPDEALKHVNTFKADSNLTAHEQAHVRELERRIADAKKKS